MFDDGSGYDLDDPKNPSFYERYVDVFDLRDKTASMSCGPNGCDDMEVCSCYCDADCECKTPEIGVSDLIGNGPFAMGLK